MMIERTTDPSFVARYVADPAMAEIVANAVANSNNLCLTGEFAVALFVKLAAGIYELAVQALPDTEPNWIRGFAADAIARAFVSTDSVELLMRVRAGHGAAQEVVRAAEWDRQFNEGGIEVYSLTLQRWAKQAPGMIERGKRLYSQIAALPERERQSVPDDWSRIMGTALSMVQAGRVDKGIVWYNRSAVMARKPLIELLGTEPVQIKTEFGILTVNGDDVQIACLN